jgi:hypothetical protein
MFSGGGLPILTERQKSRARSYGLSISPGFVSGARKAKIERFISFESQNDRAIFRYNRPRAILTNAFSGQYNHTISTHGVSGRITALTILHVHNDIEQMFDRLIFRVSMLQNLRPNDRIQIIFFDTAHAHPISTLFDKVSKFTGLVLLQLIEASLQSFETIDLDRTRIIVKYSRALNAGGYTSMYTSCKDFVRRKKCCVEIVSKNNDCFFQCLVLGILQWTDEKEYKKLTSKSALSKRSKLADQYRRRYSSIAVGEGVSISSIQYYVELFQMEILVVDFTSMSFLRRSTDTYDKYICLLYSKEQDSELAHFDYVNYNKIGALWNRRKFCFECYAGYQDSRHRCIKKCIACRSQECAHREKSIQEAFVTCSKCNLLFFDEDCYNRHFPVCEKEHKCLECSYIYKVDKKNPHVCYKRRCKNCKCLVDIRFDHRCYHQSIDPADIKKPSDKYIFYDYECMIDCNGKHIVAGVVAMYGSTEEVFTFENNDDFIEWLFSKKHKSYTVIAHNGGRYDFHFVKGEMIKRGIKSEDVCNGCTIFYSYVKAFKMRFIDSYRLIPLPLRAFSKTFGLTETCKGYFPYRFFTPDNMFYEGPMPRVEWFDFNKMKEKDREDALKWYDEHKEDEINLYTMCMKYCESDVLLLKLGCLELRKWFMKITGDEIDPLQYITIASVCMTLYRRFFLPTNTIGILKNVSIHDKPVERAIWLRHKMNEKQREFELNRNGYDAWDGDFYYDFLNCLENGCRKCFTSHRLHPVSFKPMHELNYLWRQKKCQNYIYIWGCQFDKFVHDEKPEMFIPEHIPLNMRDAFFGGRTEPIHLYYKCKDDEKILYRDYTSLYPSIQSGLLRGVCSDDYNITRTVDYPVGHPVSIRHNFGSLSEYFGFIKCTVEPPQDLHLPLLPVKINGKLIFDNITRTGTWTTIEVEKAVSLGYKILKIYEIVHFSRRSSDLFRSYVQMFLKIKQEAKGWEKLGCTTEESKRNFIEEFRLRQGIELDYNAIDEWNPGKYLIAKLCLNNLWGKFGQRDLFRTTLDTFTHEEFDKIMHNDSYEIHGCVMHNDIVRTLTFKPKTEFMSIPGYTNIAIAAFTTAHARLRLYEALEAVKDDVLYMDTDSVIYIDRGNSPLVTGPLLGDLTDELSSKTWITEFVSTGPKSYAYKDNLGRTTCKVKGITLNHDTSKLINFEKMKEVVFDPSQTVLTKPLQFVIGEKHDIETKQWKEYEGKKFKLTFDKRKIQWGHGVIHSVPFANNKK